MIFGFSNVQFGRLKPDGTFEPVEVATVNPATFVAVTREGDATYQVWEHLPPAITWTIKLDDLDFDVFAVGTKLMGVRGCLRDKVHRDLRWPTNAARCLRRK